MGHDRRWRAGPAPQDINGLNGKVLRLKADGSASADNPFVNQPGDDRIYTFGHRNPHGIAFRPGTGQPYSIEHGPDKNDEVNRSSRAGTVVGTRTPGATTSRTR